MNVIIVGGGQTGVYVAKLLLANHCSVKVLENRKSVFEKLRNDLPQEYIVNASGTDPDVLEKIGISAADVFVSVTGEDEINLMASTIAKFEFGVPRVIARVNNPKNTWLFNAGMGVDVTINQADLIGHLIIEGIDLKNMLTLLKVGHGDASIVQIHVGKGSAAAGHRVRDLGLPQQAILVAVLRGGESFIPRGDTVLAAEDDVLALASGEAEIILNTMFAS